MNQTDAQELSTLQQFAAIGKRLKNNDLEHLDAPMGAFNYIRMANFIADHLACNRPVKNDSDMQTNTCAKFLDWGAGYGQVTWLLRNKGIDAQGYNVEERQHIKEFPQLSALNMKFSTERFLLPYENETFDGVSSCGVLEHVPEPLNSLKEIYRILKPGGFFYLFMLPQKTSWVEYLSTLRGNSVHPVKYTTSGIKNLTGLPASIKNLYGKFYRVVYPLDRLLSAIPVLNLLSGVIEGVARKK